MGGKDLINQFQKAYTNDGLVVLEGFHAIKHAIRFNAELELICKDLEADMDELYQLAPDIKDKMESALITAEHDVFEQLSPYPPRTGVIAIAKKPNQAIPLSGRLVYLEDPRDLNNIGAVIRVAAASNAVGVLVTSEVDPWHPNCLRGSAGLHFALPVIHTEKLPSEFGRPSFVFDPEGEDMTRVEIPEDAVLVFGSERSGVSTKVKEDADKVVAIPMRDKVSSLNLATSVAIGLYSK